MLAAAVSHATPKNLDGHGSHNPTKVHSSVFKIVDCITTVMAVSQQPQHGTAAWDSWLSSCCGTLSGLAPQPHRRHLSVPPSTTRGDRCPVQHGTVRPNLSRQQLATTGQTWRALRLLPSSNTCTIWSLPWLLGCPRNSIPVGIVERVSSPAAGAEEPRLRTD